jgi:hypothetical protein
MVDHAFSGEMLQRIKALFNRVSSACSLPETSGIDRAALLSQTPTCAAGGDFPLLNLQSLSLSGTAEACLATGGSGSPMNQGAVAFFSDAEAAHDSGAYKGVERFYFCDAEGWLREVIQTSLCSAAAQQQVCLPDSMLKAGAPLPYMRFLLYRAHGSSMAPHVDLSKKNPGDPLQVRHLVIHNGRLTIPCA